MAGDNDENEDFDLSSGDEAQLNALVKEKEDFDLSSGDEAQLIALVESTEEPHTGSKRKVLPTNEAPEPKKLAVQVYPTQNPLALVS